MPEPVAAVPVRPPRLGLVAAASALGSVDERWQSSLGFESVPEGCGASGVLELECEGDTAQMQVDGGQGLNRGTPFVVWAGDRCSTFGFQSRDWPARARRQLEVTRSFQIARELWDGALGIDNPLLTDATSDTVTSGAADPVDALACLEAGMAEQGFGRQGMIHMPPQLMAHYVSASAVVRDGATLVSPMGHVVVPDAGYTGSGPGGSAAGASQWMYGTDVVALRLAEVTTIPTSLSDARDLAAAMNRSVNDIVVWAVQLVAYQWDRCVHVAAEVNLGICSLGGGS